MHRSTKVLIVVVLAFSVHGIASAVIPDQGGLIHACYVPSSGELRVADSEDGTPAGCSTRETALTWNQTGPQGPTGAQGPAGTPGAQGPRGVHGIKGRAGVVKVQGRKLKTLSERRLLGSILKKLNAMDADLKNIRENVSFNKSYLQGAIRKRVEKAMFISYEACLYDWVHSDFYGAGQDSDCNDNVQFGSEDYGD